ncbi:HDOD domain-containing protein [Massilia sp. PAMC28688]|nr:HDOD domain-containing protein [Massilia sp. PAMC28688]
MPGFTRAIGAILCAMRGEDDAQFNMTRTVLSDPVLTHKVLRLANSGMYAAFGQRVSTVSRAVLVLGADAIGHLALGLKAIEDVAGSASSAVSAHAEMEKAVLSGVVARQIADAGLRGDGEEAVVCAMLHSLGRMTVTYYLPERWAAMQAHAGQGLEEQAAPAVLGLTLEDVGQATAQRWGLPRRLVESMRASGPRSAGQTGADGDWLATVATLASRCAAALWHDDDRSRATLRALAHSFGPVLGLQPGQIMGAVDLARGAAAAQLSLAPLAKDVAVAPVPTVRAALARRIADGVADMRQAGGSARPGQMVAMALETIYQGLGFTRAVAFRRHRQDARYVASMGLGEDISARLPALHFDDSYLPDVFHAALASDRVIFIANACEPQFRRRLPAWWSASLGQARSFVILPLCRNGQPVGFLYGDWVPDLPQPQLDQQQFAALNELRAMVVASIAGRRA